jgi:hypothetical protein
MTKKAYKTVKVEKEDGITWVILNRPEKRNAMSPQLHFEMVDVLVELESDDDTRVLVLTAPVIAGVPVRISRNSSENWMTNRLSGGVPNGRPMSGVGETC